MLTARGEEGDRVRGLATGADDYVVKPFSVPELMARVKALLRRAAPQRVADTLQRGDIVLDRAAHRVMRRTREVRLGPTEFKLLEFFMENAGRVLSRQQLLDGVWGRDAFIDGRTVDVHVGRLRKALIRGADSDPIRTVRGAGYVFDGKAQLRFVRMQQALPQDSQVVGPSVLCESQSDSAIVARGARASLRPPVNRIVISARRLRHLAFCAIGGVRCGFYA